MPTTADHPKCFAQVQGKSILDRNVLAFAANGIRDICFIGGYQMGKVQEAHPEFTFRHNPDWENNNILESLMCARDLMNAPFISCYSDTLFSSPVVSGLMDSSSEITLSIDTDWKTRYADRTEHPPDDAEKVITRNGLVERVHRGIEFKKATGEFTGVAKFSEEGAACLRAHYVRCRNTHTGKPWREAPVFEKAYLIMLLQEMLEQGLSMAHADTSGEYMEIDTQQDFEMAQTRWKF